MSAPKQATLYRMVMPGHTCPYGLKSLDLLNRKGYEVEDKHLASREQTDAFKKEHGVETTPQVFINGRRVGGYDDLRKFFGMSVKDKNAVTYTPVIALFAMAAARLGIHMEDWQGSAKLFDATLSLSRQPLSRSTLHRHLLSFPWMTAKTVLAIYWEALRLLIKRIPLFTHQPALGTQRVAMPLRKESADEKL